MESRKYFQSVGTFIILQFLVVNATDTITKTQFISDNGTNEWIASLNGDFKLGFFSPGNSSLSRYIGIWFGKIPKITACWVANGESPLKNSSGVFKISDDGNIALFDNQGKTPVWSTNVSLPKNVNTTAKLLSSGNLVLLLPNGSVVWESFEHPTDTSLPGMKLGLNRRTRKNQVLTSWKSSDDPSPGDFTFKLSTQGPPQLFMYKGSDPLWRGGPWNGRTLSGIPEILTRLRTNQIDFSKQESLFNYSFIDTAEETYIVFHTISSIFSTLYLDYSGLIKRQIWHEKLQEWLPFWVDPQDECDRYKRCGSNGICNLKNVMVCRCLPGFAEMANHDWMFKCGEQRKYHCGKGDGEGFVKMVNVKVPDATFAEFYWNLSLQQCQNQCLRNCSCKGYASADLNEGGLGCYAWYGELDDMQAYGKEDGQDFYIRVDALVLAEHAESSKKGQSASRKALVIVIVSIITLIISLFLVIFLLVAVFHRLRRKETKNKGHKRKRGSKVLLEMESDFIDCNDPDNAGYCTETVSSEMTFFDLEALKAATDNFSSDNRLGGGGFGPVHKGRLSNGQEIAVKRLSKNSGQGFGEFKNEILLIAKLQHRNLVKVLGCCVEEEEKMLVYEYMPNKSLDHFIFDDSRKALLDWETRFGIIIGIARGILYLHQDSRLRIIHRDLKTSNILLDKDMNPKISDFGTARVFGVNQSRANTCRVMGTFGYMSPEYALDGLFSTKSDVFSFGIILLEIISGQKNAGFFQDDPSSNLLCHVWNLWREDRAEEIIDASMKGACPVHEAIRCIQVGLLCVQDGAENRPTMADVVFMLSNQTDLNCPEQPTFATMRKHGTVEPLSVSTATNSVSSSVNEVTVTTNSGE